MEVGCRLPCLQPHHLDILLISYLYSASAADLHNNKATLLIHVTLTLPSLHSKLSASSNHLTHLHGADHK